MSQDFLRLLSEPVMEWPRKVARDSKEAITDILFQQNIHKIIVELQKTLTDPKDLFPYYFIIL